MNTAHTQGQWTKQGFRVYGWMHSFNGGQPEVICDTLYYGNAMAHAVMEDKTWDEYIKECEANAKIIAAAPSLLDALEKANTRLLTLKLNIEDILKHGYGEDFSFNSDSLESVERDYQLSKAAIKQALT